MQTRKEVIDIEDWMSPAARAERKAKSLAAKLSPSEIAELAKGEPLTVEQLEKFLSRRKAGKLQALARIAKIGFNKRFKQVGKYRYIMVE